MLFFSKHKLHLLTLNSKLFFIFSHLLVCKSLTYIIVVYAEDSEINFGFNFESASGTTNGTLRNLYA